jgi:hypothetical protein
MATIVCDDGTELMIRPYRFERGGEWVLTHIEIGRDGATILSTTIGLLPADTDQVAESLRDVSRGEKESDVFVGADWNLVMMAHAGPGPDQIFVILWVGELFRSGTGHACVLVRGRVGDFLNSLRTDLETLREPGRLP